VLDHACGLADIKRHIGLTLVPIIRLGTMVNKWAYIFIIVFLGIRSSWAGDCSAVDPSFAPLAREAALVFDRTDSFSGIYNDGRFRKVVLKPKVYKNAALCLLEMQGLSYQEATSIVILMQRLSDRDYLRIVEVVYEGERRQRLPAGVATFASAPPEAFAESAIRRHESSPYRKFYDRLVLTSSGDEGFYIWLTSGRCIYDSFTWFDVSHQDRICGGRMDTRAEYLRLKDGRLR
jgi:hypothetical protein